MSLEQASLVSQIVSAVAVLVSLFYLGLQIRNNTRALRSQAYYNSTTLANRPFEMMVESEALTKIINVGYTHPEALTDDEWTRFSTHSFMMFIGWEYLYHQNNDKSIPAALWVGSDRSYKSLVKTHPGLARAWSEHQNSFAEPFRSYAAREVMTNGAGQAGLTSV